MRLSELKLLLTAAGSEDPDPVITIDVDMGAAPGRIGEMRSTRRVVDVKLSLDRERLVIEADGTLRHDEEQLLDDGMYNRVYAAYETHWNGLLRSARRYVLGVAELRETGLSITRYEDSRWDELPLRIQQMIIVRLMLPVPMGVTYEPVLVDGEVRINTGIGTVLEWKKAK